MQRVEHRVSDEANVGARASTITLGEDLRDVVIPTVQIVNVGLAFQARQPPAPGS